MLSTNYTVIGIGRYQGGTFGTYWTTVFGGYDDGWMAVSDIAPPVAEPSVIDGPLSTSSTSLGSHPPGEAGHIRRPLDFSATCAALGKLNHPLADLFC
jgi:hypothetical protein